MPFHLFKCKFTVSLLFLLTTFLFTCQDEPAVPIFLAGPQEFGWATGVRSGQQWESSGYFQFHQNDSTLIGISFQTYNEFDELRESYDLNEIPLSPGTYAVKGGPNDLGDGFVGGSYHRLGADGDAHLGSFPVNEDEDGFITIESYDETTKTIKGTFDLYFASEYKVNPVEILDGVFEVRLVE